MRIETLSERIANAENNIGNKQRTMLKKQELIACIYRPQRTILIQSIFPIQAVTKQKL